jgi:hypothetical protein
MVTGSPAAWCMQGKHVGPGNHMPQARPCRLVPGNTSRVLFGVECIHGPAFVAVPRVALLSRLVNGLSRGAVYKSVRLAHAWRVQSVRLACA